MAIYDTMQFLDCDVATYCVGLSASGGAIVLAGGTKGKRFCLPHSKIMIHQPYGEVGGQVSDIEIQAKEILETREILNEILAKHTGQPMEVIATRHRARPLPDGGPSKSNTASSTKILAAPQEEKARRNSPKGLTMACWFPTSSKRAAAKSGPWTFTAACSRTAS